MVFASEDHGPDFGMSLLESFQSPLRYMLLKISRRFIINYHMKKYVIVTDWLLTYVTLEALYFAKKLGWEFVILSKLDRSIFLEPSNILLITYNDFDLTTIQKHPDCKIIYKVDDYHGENQTRKNCILSANLVISPYAYLIKESVQKLWIPYSCVDEFVKDIKFNETPTNAVFTSGAISWHYPFREYVQSLNDERIVRKGHPGYHAKFSEDSSGVAKDYQKILNSYICCFTDASIYGYVLLKNFEIAGSGSLLLTDRLIEPQMNELGFVDNVNCMFCTKETFVEKINFILDLKNRDKIDQIRKAGMELVHSRHLTSHRTQLFISLLE